MLNDINFTKIIPEVINKDNDLLHLTFQSCFIMHIFKVYNKR